MIGHELRGAGAVADDSDALPLEVDLVIPLRGVERRAGEVIEAGESGMRGRLSWPTALTMAAGLDRLLAAVGRAEA